MKELLKARDDVVKMQKLLADRLKELNVLIYKRCDCPVSQQVKDVRYYEGDYYNKAQTETTIRCSVCGKILKKQNQVHGYYG